MKKSILFIVCSVLVAILALGAISEARNLTNGRGIPIVSDPKDLNLVNLRNMSDYLYTDLKNQGEFGLIRRTALGIKASHMGIPNPRKSELNAGFVINKGSSGKSSAVFVGVGDFKFKDIRSAMEKDYEEYMSRNRGAGQVSETEIEGVPVTRFAYSERPYEVCVCQIPDKRAFIFAAVPKDEFGALEETLRVVQGKDALNPEIPNQVEGETTLSLTKREIERIVVFNKPKGKLRQAVANGMKKISKSLGLEAAENDGIPLEERIRGQLANSESINVKYRWDVDSRNAAAYMVHYSINQKSQESADALRELISEQVTRIGERSSRDVDRDTLGRVTVGGSGNEVAMDFVLDTPEAQFQHVSLLVGQMFRYKNVMGFLDRNGPQQ